MSFEMFLAFLLVVGAVVARPPPPRDADAGGASERSNEDDEEEQKICISFKGNSIGEVTQVKGELPPQLILKLSGHSRPKMVLYKVVTVDGEELYPEVKMLTRANVTPDRVQNREQGDGMFSTARVTPYRESSLNESAGAARSAEENNNGTEKSQIEGEIIVTQTFDAATVTEEITTLVLNDTYIGKRTTPDAASRTDDVSDMTNHDDDSELRLVTTDLLSMNGTGFTGTDYPDYRERVTNNQDNLKLLDTQTTYKTQDGDDDGNVTINLDEQVTTTGVDITTNERSIRGMGGNTYATVRSPKMNDSVSESLPETGIDESTEEIGGTDTNNAVTTEITSTLSHFVTEEQIPVEEVEEAGIQGVVDYKQELIRQNETGDAPWNGTIEEQGVGVTTTVVPEYISEFKDITITTTESTRMTTIDRIESSDVSSLDKVYNITTSNYSIMATNNQELTAGTSVSTIPTIVTTIVDSTPAHIIKEFRGLPNEEMPTTTLSSEETLGELSTNSTTTVLPTTVIPTKVLPTTVHLLSGDANEVKPSPEDMVDEEGGFENSATPSQIVTSTNEGVVKPLSGVESTNKPSENVISGSGEKDEVTDSELFDSFRELTIQDGSASMNATSTPEPPEFTDEGVVEHHILSSGEEKETEVAIIQSGTTLKVPSGVTSLVRSTQVISGDSVATSSAHYRPGEGHLTDFSLASGDVTTTPVSPSSGYSEYKISSVPESTRSTKAGVEKIEFVTVVPPVSKNIPIYNSFSESPPGGDSIPSSAPQHQLEDWEKFNNFTMIFPTRKPPYMSYNPINYPVIGGYYQPGNFYKSYNRARGQTQIVHLPWARQI